MSADDHLSVQFKGKGDKSKRDRDRAGEADAKGLDEVSEFGYSELDYGDNQWNRAKHSDKREVF